MKPLIMQSPPLPSYLVTPKPKYLPQHPILKHPQPMFLPQCERPSFTPTHNKRQNYSSVLTILRDSRVYCGNSHRNGSM